MGRHLIPVLKEAGHEVFALARSATSAQRVQQLGAVPVSDDLTHLSAHTSSALQQCEAVVHAAAHMDFTYDKAPFYAINVEATQRLLSLSQQAGIAHFIYISAAPVVPGSPIVNLRESEAEPGLPKALYPKTKALAEKAILAANRPGFRTLSLRPPAIWGPENHHYEELFENARKGRWRWIGGNHQILSTIHVRNLAQAVLAGLNSALGGEAFFVTDGDRRSMRTTFSGIMQAYGIEAGEKEIPRGLVVFLAHFLGGIWKALGLKSRPPLAPIMVRLMATEFSVNDEKARQQLGYQPVLSFEDGIHQLATTGN